jgi:PqqD family protein of HPr-rel-A system
MSNHTENNNEAMSLKLSPSLAISENGFIFSSDTGDTFTMNSIGLQILRMIRENKTEKEIIEDIINEYEIDPETIEKDLQDFLHQLENFKIVIKQ